MRLHNVVTEAEQERHRAASWKYVLVADKDVGRDRLRPLLGVRRIMSAQTTKPEEAYAGSHTDDEDYTEVLQLVWETEATLLTCDGEMPNKARIFQSELRRSIKPPDRCLRGIVLLPKPADQQVVVISRLARGITVNHTLAIPPGPVWLHEIDDFNLCLDLRRGVKDALLSALCQC